MSVLFLKFIYCDVKGCTAKIIETGYTSGWWFSPRCKCVKETRVHLCPDHNPVKENEQ